MSLGDRLHSLVKRPHPLKHSKTSRSSDRLQLTMAEMIQLYLLIMPFDELNMQSLESKHYWVCSMQYANNFGKRYLTSCMSWWPWPWYTTTIPLHNLDEALETMNSAEAHSRSNESSGLPRQKLSRKYTVWTIVKSHFDMLMLTWMLMKQHQVSGWWGIRRTTA